MHSIRHLFNSSFSSCPIVEWIGRLSRIFWEVVCPCKVVPKISEYNSAYTFWRDILGSAPFSHTKSHPFFKVCNKPPPLCPCDAHNILPWYHFLLTLKYSMSLQLALNMSSLIFIVVLFCIFPMSTRGYFKNQRVGASSYCFSACILFAISHTQEVLNKWLLIVTLSALSMNLVWKRDFLSCSA